MTINAMITEDDLLSRTLLCDLLEDYFPDVSIVGMFQNVKDSVEFIKDHIKDSSGMGFCTGIPGHPGEYRLSDWQATDVSRWWNRKT